MSSNEDGMPWRRCPRCRAHGPGIAELGWLGVGTHHPSRADLSGPGHVYTCRRCGHAWMNHPKADPP